MPKQKGLPDEVKEFIVQRLACYHTPQKVVDAVNKEFGEKLTRQAVERYDPTKVAGAKLKTRWKTIFDQTRHGFINNVKAVPISHIAARLNYLQEELQNPTSPAMRLRILKQAAEEMGGMYSNRTPVSAQTDPVKLEDGPIVRGPDPFSMKNIAEQCRAQDRKRLSVVQGGKKS